MNIVLCCTTSWAIIDMKLIGCDFENSEVAQRSSLRNLSSMFVRIVFVKYVFTVFQGLPYFSRSCFRDPVYLLSRNIQFL